ncbi:hypothetical protein MJO48_09750 [Dickeya fangzhongdai]|uniref:hypothetical protein n=1 Tax=Dickeya fangzhongdai TaxID=1778540 RepID=UPI001EFBCDCE|nr:hypothetical protein [Dickeya fangzhongdai]ULR32925.1 hypothetical protein MJO48_09750 [Dickeya fangzhongdai]
MMSDIKSIIKKAFGTSNINEAATFLASACNRMKNHNREEIQNEVESALKEININHSRDHEQTAKSKVIYRDSPETTRKLKNLEKSLMASNLENNKLKNQNKEKTERIIEIERLLYQYQNIYIQHNESKEEIEKMKNNITHTEKAYRQALEHCLFLRRQLYETANELSKARSNMGIRILKKLFSHL